MVQKSEVAKVIVLKSPRRKKFSAATQENNGKPQQSQPNPSVDWLDLVAKVKADDSKGTAELRRIFFNGIRFYLSRRVGPQQLDARVQETFGILVSTIKGEDLPQQERLARLVRTIVLKQVAAYSDADSRNQSQPSVQCSGVVLDHRGHSDKKTVSLQNEDFMVGVLRRLSVRDQEALIRFYVHGQTQESIGEEMQLSERQFLLLRARLRASFREITMATS